MTDDPAGAAPRRALVRKLWPHERAAYLAHLRRLDPATRICRFGRPIDDRALEAHAAAHFNIDALVYGALVRGEVRAAGELHGAWLKPGVPAEAALSVEPAWRRQGLGAAILDLLLTAARNRGRDAVMLVCLPENIAMRRLAERRCGDSFTRLDPETGRVTLSLRTPVTLWSEFSRDAADMLKALSER